MRHPFRLMLPALICLSPLTDGVGAHGTSRPTVTPEYFVGEARAPVCIWKVSLSPDGLPEHYAPHFVAYMFDKSAGWTHGVAVVGVDYVAFRSLYLVFDKPCGTGSQPDAPLTTFFGAGRYRAEVVKATPFVALENLKGEAKTSTGMFLRFQGVANLGACLAALQTPNIDSASEASSKLHGIWRRFRLPLSDVAQINRVVYILFSRDCSAKEKIFENILSIAEETYPATKLGPIKVDFNPDTKGYMFLRNIP